MEYAAHLRYHWMEPILYNYLRYMPIAIIGVFSAQEVALVHFFNIMIGHLNHANIHLDYGLLKYVLNNPKIHIWPILKTMLIIQILLIIYIKCKNSISFCKFFSGPRLKDLLLL